MTIVTRLGAAAALFPLLLTLCEAAEPRSREWLIRYVRQPIPETPPNQRSFNLIQRQLDDNYLGLDLEFLEKGGADKSRVQTNTIGRLAFCYRTPGLPYYRDARLLEKLRLAYLAVSKHIGPDGFIEWSGDTDYFFQAHEQAWRLEPFLLGYIWVGEEFPAQDRAVIEAAIRRSAEWLIRHPLNQTNNRGAVWCAIATLCGIYLEKPEYLSVVEKYASSIMRGVVWDDGEVGEHTAQYGGGGPDSNYSYTGWAYVYLYRLFSGNDEMDEKLLQALRWFAVYNTLRGFPIVTGASVRSFQWNPANMQDILPALERFSRQEPFFATLSRNILEKKEKFFPVFGGHIVSPLIWAMLEHGAEPSPAPLPDWYVNHTRMYDRQEVQYALVGRAYQTGVVFRGKKGEGRQAPFRGLQTFAAGDEYPILLHTDTALSMTKADGIETAATDVDRGPGGWEVFLAKGAKVGRSELATIAERRKTLWTLYAFTAVSAVVVYGGAKGKITSRWVMNRAVVSQPSLDSAKRSVSFQGNHGRIGYLAGKARLFSAPDKSADVLEVIGPAPVNAFGFSDGSFRFQKYDRARRQFLFSDRSGRYCIALQEMLGTNGMLNRGEAFRLTLRP